MILYLSSVFQVTDSMHARRREAMNDAVCSVTDR